MAFSIPNKSQHFINQKTCSSVTFILCMQGELHDTVHWSLRVEKDSRCGKEDRHSTVDHDTIIYDEKSAYLE